MSDLVVALAYGTSVAVAFACLYVFRAKAWYLHALSVAAAFGLGVTPLPASWHTPRHDVIVGSIFLLLFVWGAAAPFFRGRAHETHAHSH